MLISTSWDWTILMIDNEREKVQNRRGENEERRMRKIRTVMMDVNGDRMKNDLSIILLMPQPCKGNIAFDNIEHFNSLHHTYLQSCYDAQL